MRWLQNNHKWRSCFTQRTGMSNIFARLPWYDVKPRRGEGECREERSTGALFNQDAPVAQRYCGISSPVDESQRMLVSLRRRRKCCSANHISVYTITCQTGSLLYILWRKGKLWSSYTVHIVHICNFRSHFLYSICPSFSSISSACRSAVSRWLVSAQLPGLARLA